MEREVPVKAPLFLFLYKPAIVLHSIKKDCARICIYLHVEYYVRMKTPAYILVLLAACFAQTAPAQVEDTTITHLTDIIAALAERPQTQPEETVYLHLDNTSYYRGDKLWFSAYVVDAARHEPSGLSKTLYVELLGPSGTVVQRRVLEIADGRCHGDMALDFLPFQSGFHELRAYTRYMLDNNPGGIYSRVLPIFDSPAVEGDYSERRMQHYAGEKGGYKRPSPRRGSDINLKFYPEGGRLVEGLAQRVAYELTDADGRPLDGRIRVTLPDGSAVAESVTGHGGRGTFDITPQTGVRISAEATCGGRTRRFELPEAVAQGIAMRVDRSASPDTVDLYLQKGPHTPAVTAGVALTCRGDLCGQYVARLWRNTPVRIRIPRSDLPTGVIQLTCFDEQRRVLASRLMFNDAGDALTLTATTDRDTYAPYEKIELDLSVTDSSGARVSTPVSISVADAAEHVRYDHNILTDLLLSSELRGYIDNPAWYFESSDPGRLDALDRLLMVQGWRRYVTDTLPEPGEEPDIIAPERGIEVRGRVVTYVRQKPRPDATVSVMLSRRGDEDEEPQNHVGALLTDEDGRFAFCTDIQGKWNMILSVSEKGKRQGHRILLERITPPEPRAYSRAEMRAVVDSIAGAADEIALYQAPDAEADTLLQDEKIIALDELTVTGKRSEASQVFVNRSESVAFYDLQAELDDIIDSGKLVDNIVDVMLEINPNFRKYYNRNREEVRYKMRRPLFVVDYNQLDDAGTGGGDASATSAEAGAEAASNTGPDVGTEKSFWQPGADDKARAEEESEAELDDELQEYLTLPLQYIKSVYINEDPSIISQYAPPSASTRALGRYGCVVFIETFPPRERQKPATKGSRKTWIDGYNTPDEFYSIDYSYMPPEPDYRRTLYWNPALQTDADGRAHVTLYNNSTATRHIIDAQTVTATGAIGATRTTGK